VIENFIQIKTLWSNPVCAPDIDEASGLSHVIHWMRDLQLTNVDFKLDAKKGCRLLQWRPQ